jgi:molecular chaperone DnaK
VVEVVSTNGDTHLGGDDIDLRVMDWLIAEFKKDQGIDVSKDKMVIQRLREAAEKAKIELSSVSETEINLPFLTADASGPKHMQVKLSRAKLEQLMEDLVNRTIEPTKKALSDAGKKPSDIVEVVLVGGSTRIPMVQKLVKEFFGKEPQRASIPTRSWRWARRSRPACSRATSRTCCSWTSRRFRWASRPWAAS